MGSYLVDSVVSSDNIVCTSSDPAEIYYIKVGLKYALEVSGLASVRAVECIDIGGWPCCNRLNGDGRGDRNTCCESDESHE